MDEEEDMNKTKRLPDEVFMEILSWLPIKTLLRLKCVSKSWLRLLTTDPHLPKLQLERTLESNINNPNILLLQQGDRETNTNYYLANFSATCPTSVKLNVPFRQDTYVRGICNGLVLLHLANIKDSLYIWNPLTGDYIAIPCPPTPTLFPSRHKTTTFGFGFHQASNRYKVVRFVDEFDKNNFVFNSCVSVYTLGRDSSWRTLEKDNHYKVCFMNSFAPTVNGALHWRVYKTGLHYHKVIVSFDLNDEVFQEIPIADDATINTPYDVEVRELGGLLCLLCDKYLGDRQIWVMKQYGVISSWTKQFQIVCKVGLSCSYVSLPLGVANNGDLILMKSNSELVLYDQESNSIRDLKNFGFKPRHIYTYRESLVSPNVISGSELVRT